MVNSRGMRDVVVTMIVVMLAASGVWATEAAKPRAATGMMSAIPAKSLFCIRINNFDSTLEVANDFLRDVVPESFDAKAAVLSQLGKLLGDERLRGVNKKGNIAIFCLTPDKSAPSGPMRNPFIGVLIPVRKYEDFFSGNPNCGEPDEQGVSTITVDGKPSSLATNLRRFALLCSPDARENLIRVKKLMAQGKQGLGWSLDLEERKRAARSPVWFYLNVKQGSELIQPLLMAGLDKMKTQLEETKKSGKGPSIDPSGIVGLYAHIFRMVLDGTNNVTMAITPTAEVCNITLGVKPTPDTTMAAIVGKPLGGDLGNMLGYLDDGAMYNLGFKVNKESLKTIYLGLFKSMGQMIPEGLSETELNQLRMLMDKGINAMGDSLAISFGVSGESSPPFCGKYIIKVLDQEAFEQVLEKELQLLEEGILADLYKGFGVEMEVEVNHNAGSYKGIDIGGAKMAFKMGDENIPESQMLGKMFGEHLDYRWAFVEGNCVYTVGRNASETIRELIDQVRAGGPKQVGSEMKAALAAIPDSDQADVVGTFNYVRMLNMVLDFMPISEDIDATEFKVSTKGNVAFAGSTTTEGKLEIQIAIPRTHLLEIKSAFEKLIPKIEKQREALQGYKTRKWRD